MFRTSRPAKKKRLTLRSPKLPSLHFIPLINITGVLLGGSSYQGSPYLGSDPVVHHVYHRQRCPQQQRCQPVSHHHHRHHPIRHARHIVTIDQLDTTVLVIARSAGDLQFLVLEPIRMRPFQKTWVVEHRIHGLGPMKTVDLRVPRHDNPAMAQTTAELLPNSPKTQQHTSRPSSTEPSGIRSACMRWGPSSAGT